MYSWDAVDEAVYREATALQGMRQYQLRTPASRVKHYELRAGLEILDGRKRFNALFKG